MNMMSVLLGATGLLLVAALVLSFGSMNKNVGTEPTKKEIAALRTEIEVLRAAEAELRLLNQQKSTANAMAATSYTPQPYTTPAPASVVDANAEAEKAAEIAALKQEVADAQAEAERQAKRAETFNEEANLALQNKIESSDSERRQARVISEALLIATVTQWSPTDGFLVLNINRPESAQEGSVLAIRRNTGIIGRVKVAQIYPDGATADPLPGSFFGGSLDIKPGDELIIPPN